MQRFHRYKKIVFEQNNRSWAGDDTVIYRSWRVDAVRDLHPPVLWPRELVAIVVGVTVVEEVVADADELVLEAISVVVITSAIAYTW
jgi:hypothetical protein